MSNRKKFAAVLIGAGALLVIGALMPWVTFLGVFSLAGSSTNDGRVVLALGIILAGLGAWHLAADPPRKWAVAGLVVTVVALGFVVYDLSHLEHAVASENHGLGSVGNGLWVCVIGGIGALVGSFGMLRAVTEEAPPKVGSWLWRSRRLSGSPDAPSRSGSAGEA